MPKKHYEQFEIIEDPDALPPPRKRKRKFGPFYIPWRWVVASFAVATVVVGLAALALFLLATPTRVETNVVTVERDMARSGDQVAVTGANSPRVETNNVVTVVPTMTGEGEMIRDMVWSGDQVAVAGTNSLRVYDDILHPAAPRLMNDYGEAMGRVFNTIALSPDQSQVAGIVTLVRNETTESDVAVWDTTTGDLLRKFTAHVGGNGMTSYDGEVKAIAYSPDGSRMVTGAGDGQLLVWDAATGEQIASLKSGGMATWALAFRPDSNQCAAFIEYDQQNSGLQIWDVATGEKVSEIALNGHNVWQVALSQDVAYMALREWRESDNFVISLWDVERGQEIGIIPLHEAHTVDGLAVKANVLALVGSWGLSIDDITGDIKEPHTELRIVRWDADAANGFQYEVTAMKEDFLNQADIYQLHFETDANGATWINYLSDASSDLQRWNLDTGATESIRFW